MKHKIQRALKDPKLLSIAVLGIVAIALIAFLLVNEKVEPFKIQDRCGVFVNLESHTIADEETCQTRCRSQCISKDYSFKKVEFTKPEAGCNTCMCHCK